MAISNEEKLVLRKRMFGHENFPEEVVEYLEGNPGARMMALSMLSDLQSKVSAMATLLHDQEVVPGMLMSDAFEKFRQEFNKIKHVVDEHLRTKPSEKEVNTLEALLDLELSDSSKQDLRWLMDVRR